MLSERQNGKKTALVTGAHVGIGRNIADTLAVAGYQVFGTSRSDRPNRKGVSMLRLDVRDEHEVRKSINQLTNEVGPIDLLVSNAGLTVVAPSEELPIDVAKDMMDVNFFGTARIANAVLPGMRDRQAGHLIFISSLAGQMGVPGQGYYCATKHAIEGYADGLRAEVKPFGIKVTILEPGSFRTKIIEKSAEPEWPTISAYDGIRERLRDVIAEATKKGEDPQLLADLCLKVATTASPRLRYRVDTDGKRAMFFKSMMPESIFYGVVEKRFGM